VLFRNVYGDWLFEKNCVVIGCLKKNYILIGTIILNSSAMVSQAVLVEAEVSIPYFPLKWVKIV